MLTSEQLDTWERMGLIHELANLAQSQLAEITQLKATIGILESANDELREIVKGGAK